MTPSSSAEIRSSWPVRREIAGDVEEFEKRSFAQTLGQMRIEFSTFFEALRFDHAAHEGPGCQPLDFTLDRGGISDQILDYVVKLQNIRALALHVDERLRGIKRRLLFAIGVDAAGDQQHACDEDQLATQQGLPHLA